MILWMRRRRAARHKVLMAWASVAGMLALLADVHPAMTQTPLDL